MSRANIGFDTPLMRQWRQVKSRHLDDLVFFRVGDFYELFAEDAEEGSRLLGLTLTSRNNGAAQRVPLAGVPAKALGEYVDRLVKLGKKAVICDQVEDPAKAKGIVRREVVETVTPGTVVSDALLDASRNNFIVALVAGQQDVGLAAMDVSTGQLVVLGVPRSRIHDELALLEPSELLVPESADPDPGEHGPAVLTTRPDWLFDPVTAREELTRRYKVHSLDGFGFEAGDELLIGAAGGLVAYVEEIRPGAAENLCAPRLQRSDAVMTLDSMTRRNLELVEPLRGDQKQPSLLSVLDLTATPMGARLLREWVLRPLLDEREVWKRLNGVTELFDVPRVRSLLRSALGGIRDLDRLATKIGSGRATPREALALAQSVRQTPAVIDAGAGAESDILRELLDGLDTLEDVEARITEAISGDAPATLGEGGVIRRGFDKELDRLREIRDSAEGFIAGLEARERERTGIASLKVGQNKVFGYYLEVTNANRSRVPEHFIRKQTLSNAERYFTPELKDWEEKVFNAEDRIAHLERALFLRVRGELALTVPRIQVTSRRIASLDVLAGLAEVAERNGYVHPEVTTGFTLDIVAGRHPVVETVMPGSDFIPNDLRLDEEGRIAIVTGPNMAGKSTVLRQTGLIQIMAQIGSFVPATSARLGMCDRVFTRVGASDNLLSGQSTFMVEMNETSAIIHGATERSLILLDEIGRGTSTYDGVSIAWAVTEHLHNYVGAKAIFATHYHELTQLSDVLSGVKNLNVAVREAGEEIVFLRRLEAGGADRSYGIHVARLAGIPPAVIARAKQLLAELEGSELEGTRAGSRAPLGRGGGAEGGGAGSGKDQLSLFEKEHPVVARLRSLEPDRMTPLEALSVIYSLRAAATEP